MNTVKIKSILKKSGVIEKILRIAATPYFLAEMVFSNIDMQRRAEGYDDNNYLPIKAIKNSAQRKRCFIVGTGPSLRLEDLEKLKGEVCFSMNSVVLLFQNVTWRPTYYGIQDAFVLESIKDQILSYKDDFKMIFVPRKLKKEFLNDPQIVAFPMNCLNRRFYHAKPFTKFSGDSYATVYEGFTIAYSLLQIAVYMGYKEIYLLGTDCDYSGPTKHIAEYKNLNAHEISTAEKMIYAYTIAQEYAQNHDIRIYNATRGGKLEVFPRVEFDELFKGESE